MWIILFVNNSLPLKDDGIQLFSLTHIRILKKQRVCIFKFWDWKNLLSFPSPFSLYGEKAWKREPKRPPKSMDTLSWKQEKNDPIWRANTHAHTHTYAHTIIPLIFHLCVFPIPHFNLSLSLSVYLYVFFLCLYMENPKSTSPHHLVLVSLQAPPHFPLSSL